jgi:hypothetical protein
VTYRQKLIAAAALSAVAGLSQSVRAQTPATEKANVTTISWSGATLMRSFTSGPGISYLNPGTSITLTRPNGTTVTYTAKWDHDSNPATPDIDTTQFQLAALNPTSTVTSGDIQRHYAVRFEWHEQGSIEGIQELINDQVGPITTVGLLNRNGNAGNPLWVNQTGFGRNGANVVPAPAPFGSATPGVSSVTSNGKTVWASNYNPVHASQGGNYDDSNIHAPGLNTQGGQNRVQQAVSDVPSIQGFAVVGAAAVNRIPGTAGYGQGNPALKLASATDLQGLGTGGARRAFNNGSIVNMATTANDPTTGNAYAAGPWNTAGIGNLHDKSVAVAAVALVANPGTGLARVNRTDATWLHTTGRLANGADFNVVTRDTYSGTINAATNNLGLDTSWAVGENDTGNGNGVNGLLETRIGPNIKFSGKTSGGQGVNPTVQNSRMAFGHLSISDAVPSSTNSVTRPMRVLDFRDDIDDLQVGEVGNVANNSLPAALRNNASFADPASGNNSDLSHVNGFTRLSARSIVEGSYALRADQTYVTVKGPRVDLLTSFRSTFQTQNGRLPTSAEEVTWWTGLNDNPTTGTGIKGDNSGNDVFDFRQNILTAVAEFPLASTIANPADDMVNRGFLPPQLAKFNRDITGLNRNVTNPNFDETNATIFLNKPSLQTGFNAGDPTTVTTGNSSTYGNNNIGGASGTPIGGSIPINAKNWLFGDFDQRTPGTGVSGKGVRDLSDLDVARQAQTALRSSGLGLDWNQNAGSNSGNVAGLPAAMSNTYTKGDLIVLGDFDSDGDFDGEDLRRMARGTSLANSRTSVVLTANTLTRTNADNSTFSYTEDFGDMARRGVLRKNAALDQLHAGGSAASTEQKLEARAVQKTAPNRALPNPPTAGNYTVLEAASPANNNVATYVFDSAQSNAFNKFDVNRDGRITRADAAIVDYFVGKDYTNLQHQLDAVVKVNASGIVTAFVNDSTGVKLGFDDPANRMSISLVDVDLNDVPTITNKPGVEDGAAGDFGLIRAALGSQLLDGDTNFDGLVNATDLQNFASNWGTASDAWSLGDFNADGLVNASDLQVFAANWGLGVNGGFAPLTASDQAAFDAFMGVASVPEPGSVSLLAVAVGGLLGRRRRRGKAC